MAGRVILINGLPGSGKTSLATVLTDVLQVPLISKDALKEALAVAAPRLPAGALGRVAAETMWTLAAAFDGCVVLESWWFRPRDLAYAQAGLGRTGAREVIEVWCDVPAEIARERYARRKRPAFYEDQLHLSESWPLWSAQAEPLAVSTVVRVVTDGPVDIDALARHLSLDSRG